MEKKSSETSKSVFRNVLYGFSTWILPLGLSFFATPIIVMSLGNDDYGIYALVLGFVGYSFNFNTGRAITKYIAEYRVSGEFHKISEVISATLLLNIAVGLAGAISIALLANWLVTDIFLIDSAAQTKTVHALWISAAIIFVTMLNQVFNSILQGLQRFDIYSKLFNASSFAILLGNIVLALSGFGLVALLLWNLAILVLSGVVVGIYSNHLLPGFVFSLNIKGETLKLILKFSAGIIGYQILANLLLLFERGWLMRKLGDESLTFYVVPMMLGLYIHSFISSIMLVLFPLTSELSQDREKLKRLYFVATKIACFLVVFLAVTLIVESKLFLTVWMGAEFAEKSWLLLVIHSITFGLAAILIVSWQMTEGLGYPNYNCFVFSFCLIISVGTMLFLTQDYGTVGIAIGRLAGFGTLFLSVFYVERWFFGGIQIGFWLRIVGMVGFAALLAGSTERMLSNYLSVGWVSFIIVTLCGGLVYCLVLYLLGFITDDEKHLFSRILSR